MIWSFGLVDPRLSARTPLVSRFRRRFKEVELCFTDPCSRQSPLSLISIFVEVVPNVINPNLSRAGRISKSTSGDIDVLQRNRRLVFAFAPDKQLLSRNSMMTNKNAISQRPVIFILSNSISIFILRRISPCFVYILFCTSLIF